MAFEPLYSLFPYNPIFLLLQVETALYMFIEYELIYCQITSGP